MATVNMGQDAGTMEGLDVRACENDDEARTGGLTRRNVLAAGGLVAAGSMTGCLDRVAGVVTNTDSSPAGAMSGAAAGFRHSYGSGGGKVSLAYDIGDGDVEHVPVTLRAGDGILSSEVGLDGWLTDDDIVPPAQDYNSTRSNRRKNAFVPWDDDETDDDVYSRVLELERSLLTQVDSASDSVSRRSEEDARRMLDTLLGTIDEVRAELDGCPSDVCVAVRGSADKRHQGATRASRAVDAGDWGTAEDELREIRGIIESDVRRLEDALDDETSEEVKELYAYLDDEPVIGERFCVCLPDARLPRGGPAVGDEITPRGIMEYLTGEARRCGTDGGGDLYCWGRNERARLSAEIREEENKHRRVAAFATDGGVCVTGVPADAEGAEDMVALEHCRNAASPALFKKCRVSSSADADDWGNELTEGDVTVSPTFVCPVVAQPDDAPVPFYALLYFTRCRCGDEYLYTGGWLIDDAALHHDSCTLLVAEESPAVVRFTPEDARRGNEDAARRKVRATVGDVRRRSQGAVVYDGAIDDEALEHLPDALRDGEGLDGVAGLAVASISKRSARTGRNPQTGKEIKIPARDGSVASEDETAMRCLTTALDCPVAHLTDAGGMSVDEKAAAYDAFVQIQGIDSEGEPTEA